MKRTTVRQRLSIILTSIWLVGATLGDVAYLATKHDQAEKILWWDCREHLDQNMNFTDVRRICNAKAASEIGNFDVLGIAAGAFGRALEIAAIFWGLFALVWFTVKWIRAGRRPARDPG